jgi:hypothetical protein
MLRRGGRVASLVAGTLDVFVELNAWAHERWPATG